MIEHLIIYRLKFSVGTNVGLPEGLFLRVWRPSFLHWVPPASEAMYGFYGVAHCIGLFSNSDYKCYLVMNKDGDIVHKTFVVPKYFRWPFMEPGDLCLSGLWTAPHYRREGIATAVVYTVIRNEFAKRRNIWYIVRETNTESIALCEKVGFVFVSWAIRTRPFGIRHLGRVIIQDV